MTPKEPIHELMQRETFKNVIKEAFKEAAREWLETQFATFGRWSLYGLVSAVLVGLLYFLLWVNGWHHK